MILPKSPTQVKPVGLFDAESFPDWLRYEGILSYARSSPKGQRDQSKFSHDWQRNAATYTASEKGRQIVEHVDAIGVDGRRIRLPNRPGLSYLIALAQVTGYPILAWDWSRFVRDRQLLPKLANFGVAFVTIMPLDLSSRELHVQRMRFTWQEKQRQEVH